jgi:SAM-dependent methyltransferase
MVEASGCYGSPTLLKENVQGFNLVAYRDSVYALARSLGPFDITKTDPHTLALATARGDCVIAPTLEEVVRRLEVRVLPPGAPPAEEAQCPGWAWAAASDAGEQQGTADSAADRATHRLRACLREGTPYFGPLMGAAQGDPKRHARMQQLVASICAGGDGAPLRIVEIGSWAGASAITWADALKRFNRGRGIVLCIDPWEDYFDPSAVAGGGDRRQYDRMASALTEGRIFPLFRHNVRATGHDDIILPVRAPSETVLPLLSEGSVDLVYVDGSHAYHRVALDLALGSRVLRRGGILCGDDLELQVEQVGRERVRGQIQFDYAKDEETGALYHPGVTLAVGEAFGTLSAPDGFWAIRKGPEGWVRIAWDTLAGGAVPAHLRGQGWVELLESDFLGFNLLAYDGGWYGVATVLGSVDLAHLSEEQWAEWRAQGLILVESSQEALKRRIASLEVLPSPVLVESDYHGYNLLRYRDRAYGLALTAGSRDLAALSPQELAVLEQQQLCVVDRSVDLLKRRILLADYRFSPELVEENYRGFNLVRYRAEAYALAVALGPFDLTQEPPERLAECGKQGSCLIAPTVDALKDIIEAGLPTREASRATPEGSPAPSAAGSRRPLSRRGARNLHVERGWKALYIAEGDAHPHQAIVDQLHFDEVTILAIEARRSAWSGRRVLTAPTEPTGPLTPQALSSALRSEMRERGFDVVVVPYRNQLGGGAWEAVAREIAPRLMAVFPGGQTRLYEGEPLARTAYNFAYLRSMYGAIPPVRGRRVLEVGCGDGLTSDLLALEGASVAVGVDLWADDGFIIRDSGTRYAQGDSGQLPIRRGVFDLCFSIATFEHVADPLTALLEMARVLRPGGYGYVQAAPLYHSPFGHHMFGYFDDFPWAHLRCSPEGLLRFCQRTGRDQAILAKTGRTATCYLDFMLSRKHVNQRRLAEYGIEEFARRSGVEIVRFSRSVEGEGWLTPAVQAELREYTREDLLTHGFELVFCTPDR